MTAENCHIEKAQMFLMPLTTALYFVNVPVILAGATGSRAEQLDRAQLQSRYLRPCLSLTMTCQTVEVKKYCLHG